MSPEDARRRDRVRQRLHDLRVRVVGRNAGRDRVSSFLERVSRYTAAGPNDYNPPSTTNPGSSPYPISRDAAGRMSLDGSTLHAWNPLEDYSPEEIAEDVPKCRHLLRERENYWATQPASPVQRTQLENATSVLADFEEKLGRLKAGTEAGDSIIAARVGWPADPSTPYRYLE